MIYDALHDSRDRYKWCNISKKKNFSKEDNDVRMWRRNSDFFLQKQFVK